MQPLLNLKSFLAVLMILIVPSALLVAYFRNYSAEGGGHEHSHTAASDKGGDMSAMKTGGDSHTAMGHSEMPKSQGEQMQSEKKTETSQSPAAQPQKEAGHSGMGHGNINMAQSEVGQLPSASGQMPEPANAALTREQFDMAGSSAMPGIPGVSRPYHIGATGFFLNHAEHITLSTKQLSALNRIKQKALLSKSTGQRKIDEAEQELWEVTGADEPDSALIQAKVLTIEKLRAEQRMAFIQSVGEANKQLTEEQRQMLLGTKEPDAATTNAPAGK